MKRLGNNFFLYCYECGDVVGKSKYRSGCEKIKNIHRHQDTEIFQPEHVFDEFKSADDRGRVTLGSEFANRSVKLAVLQYSNEEVEN